MSHDCPLCGGPLKDMPLTIYRERGMVVAGGQFALLTGREVDLFLALERVFPRVLTMDAAMAALYGDRVEDEPDAKIVDVFVCKLRKKLAPLGVRIETAWGKGYALKADSRPTVVSDEVAA